MKAFRISTLFVLAAVVVASCGQNTDTLEAKKAGTVDLPEDVCLAEATEVPVVNRPRKNLPDDSAETFKQVMIQRFRDDEDE